VTDSEYYGFPQSRNLRGTLVPEGVTKISLGAPEPEEGTPILPRASPRSLDTTQGSMLEDEEPGDAGVLVPDGVGDGKIALVLSDDCRRPVEDLIDDFMGREIDDLLDDVDGREGQLDNTDPDLPPPAAP
jgi:hypothetical protein